VAHVVYQNEIQPGSPELVDIFARAELTANDTSAGVGYAPLTETERLVLEAEQYLNSHEFKQRFPEVGEDVKVMAFRCDRSLSLTVAAAFVDRFIPDARRYFDRKAAVRDDLERHLVARLQTLDHLDVALNTLDDPARGLGGMYLTVLGRRRRWRTGWPRQSRQRFDQPAPSDDHGSGGGKEPGQPRGQDLQPAGPPNGRSDL
jgi:S-adenosylmethionine synthetase